MIKPLQKLGAVVLGGFMLLGSQQTLAQSNPAVQSLPYEQNFEGMGETGTDLPAGIVAWLTGASNTKEKAEGAVPSADAPIKLSSGFQSSGSSVYHQRAGGNSQLYVQLTGNADNGSNQLATAINTTGAEYVTVKYTVELLNDQPRSAGVSLQFRNGNAGAWTTVEASDYTSKAKELNSKEEFAVSLPAVAAGQELVQLRWITYENQESGVSGPRDGVGIDNISIYSDATGAPVDESAPVLVQLSPAHAAEGVSINSSPVLTFDETVYASETGAITITNTATGETTVINTNDTDKVSLSGGTVTITYTWQPETSYSISLSEGAFTDAAGNAIAALSADNWAFVTQGTAVPVADLYTENFDDCPAEGSTALAGSWMHYSVTGDETWACSEFGADNTFGVQMNGYNSGAKQNEDWLISLAYNLQDFSLPVLSVSYLTKFSGEGLLVKVSTDYSGTGDPGAATWTDLITLDSDNSDSWKSLQDINLEAYKSEGTHVAFVYYSTTQAAARWTLDNFKIENASSILSVSALNFNFGTVAVGEASEAEPFTFSAVGFEEDLVVTAPEGFELSKDMAAYSQSLTYTSGEASAQNTVYVRFKPATAAVFAGAVHFKSGEALDAEKGMLHGSSLNFDNTLDVATWNLEWFGSTANGPGNEEQQYANAKKVISELNADIVAVQEIVDEDKVRQLAEELGYKYESIENEWLYSNAQHTGVLYRPEILKVRKEKLLLSKLYADIKAGRTTLDGYPANSSTFWASGRLPYLVQFEATVNGVRQYINIVNIHAKANSGDDITQYDRRKYDVQVLKDSLDAQYADANLIMLGDFNDDIDESVVAGAGASSYKVFVDDENYKALTYELSLTGAYSLASSYQSFLDHIVVSQELEEEYIANSIAIHKEFLGSIDNYANTTSDHLPVMARFELVTSDPEQEEETPTGIADATKGQFSVYPNPVEQYVRLALPARVKGFQNVALVAYGLDGRALLAAKGSLEQVGQVLNAKAATLKQGMYILKVEAGKEVFVTRMLKK
ncbi:Ig-like domain-containing protein [Pontibacter mangrovi]|uniref:T9SS type A sorting domain-containing protein n=1 Tax=Pontibacter mangrovi TaxID=2589816 RepID=A0A501W2Z0_9BACT|nr:Ig-like domain-containing protein [Pontibacter mangrovi]TPE43648.1 T9SS type A sorting domain-containing protein [Pontibacter mangrovi]